MNLYLNFFIDNLIFFLVLLDPIGVLPFFISLTKQETLENRYNIARRTSLISISILTIFACIGEFLLKSLQISSSAMQVAGGLFLLTAAMNMTMGEHFSGSLSNNDDSDQNHRDPAIFPLAIPLIAGPGALSGIIIKTQETGGDIYLHLILLAVLVLVMGFTYGILSLSHHIHKILGTVSTNVLTRVCGIILAALSVQIIISGLESSSLFGAITVSE